MLFRMCSMPRHLTKAELLAGLPEIDASPKDNGELLGIVVRPDHGRPHPDVQLCIMNARCIALIAQACDNWAAGDNLFRDMDLSTGNLELGKRRRLRGIYARVVQDGRIAVGDRAVKPA